jgi:hypothetical protein
MEQPTENGEVLEQVAALVDSQRLAASRGEALENQVRALGDALQTLLTRFSGGAMDATFHAAPVTAPVAAPPPAIVPLDPNAVRMLEKASYGAYAKLNSTHSNSPEWQTRFLQAAQTYGLLGVFVSDAQGLIYPDLVHRASMNLLCDSIDTSVLMALKSAVISRGEVWENCRPRELYNHLQAQWSSKMHDRTYELTTELIGFELYASESISSYFERLQELWVKLTACGSPPAMDRLVDAAVRGLNRHPTFDSVCMQIKSSTEWSTMTIDKARSMLCMHEAKLLARTAQGPPRPNPNKSVGTSSVHAPLVESLPPGALDPVMMESICAFMQSRSVQGNGGRVAGRGAGRDTSTLKCFYCDKVGHIASECRSKARDKQNGTLKVNGTRRAPAATSD